MMPEKPVLSEHESGKRKAEMVIFCENDAAVLREAELLADRFGLELSAGSPDTGCESLYLKFDAGGLSLNGYGMSMRADFTSMLPRLKRGGLSGELLVRAARIRGLEGPAHVVDATAGFGEDAMLLAASGCLVDLYEYNPVIAALLADAMRRAEEVPELEAAVRRMTLHPGNSVEAMRGMALRPGDSADALREAGTPPDIICLDPMFPVRKKSSLIKKKFQLLHHLETPCGNEAELLEAALGANPKRIVIKRPAKGPYLAGIKPAYSIRGDTVRYDCIVPQNPGRTIHAS